MRSQRVEHLFYDAEDPGFPIVLTPFTPYRVERTVVQMGVTSEPGHDVIFFEHYVTLGKGS